jgi:hypothetical protein
MDVAEYCRKGEFLVLISLIQPIYGSFMFSAFFFLEFDVVNQVVREVLGVTPRFDILFLPFIVGEFVVSGVITSLGTLPPHTVVLSLRSTSFWLSIITPTFKFTRLMFRRQRNETGGSSVTVSVDNEALVKPLVALHTYKAFQVFRTRIHCELEEHKVVMLQHSFLLTMLCIFSYSLVRHFEQMTVATMIAYPTGCFILLLYEYLQAKNISDEGKKSEDFILAMKSMYGCSKYMRKHLRSLKPFQVDTWYPAKKDVRNNFNHFMLLYSLNTTDLLLAF